MTFKLIILFLYVENGTNKVFIVRFRCKTSPDVKFVPDCIVMVCRISIKAELGIISSDLMGVYRFNLQVELCFRCKKV